MCDTCGCGDPGSQVRIIKPGEVQESSARPGEHHHHSHGHSHAHHDHDHNHEHDHDLSNSGQRLLSVQKGIMEKNQLLASRNRAYFDARNILVINIMSSPGSGKTTLLEHTIRELKDQKKLVVIEGDQQTMNDAERIESAGAPVVQVNTGNACHLDAEMVMKAVKKLDPETGSILFIENVGNLVCPSLFELGEHYRLVMVSTTEGDDKPLKYSTMFAHADLCIFSKTDLLPYVDFSTKKSASYAQQMNPNMEFMELSAKSGEGMKEWIRWILEKAG